MDEDLIALMRGCAEFPNDLARRLILADYLEEHGRPLEAEWWRRFMFSTTRTDTLILFRTGDVNSDEWYSENPARDGRSFGDGDHFGSGEEDGHGDGAGFGFGWGHGSGAGFGYWDDEEYADKPILWNEYTQPQELPQGEIT